MRIAQTAVLLATLFLAADSMSPAGELPANQWVLMKDADFGRRVPRSLIYSPEVGRFMTLGGELNWDAKGDQPYGDLALDIAEGKWENWYPQGKSFGPKFGPCQAPGFNPYYGNLFKDSAGNDRANPSALMWRTLDGLYAHDSDAKKFYFHSAGMTWCYDPVARHWESIETATHPTKMNAGPLLWSSMCYDAALKRFVLFGGGDVQTERGDPGTWTFEPATKQWAELKLDKQPPPRANSQLAYDPVSKKIVLYGGDGLNELFSDTWTFDGQKWEERKPSLSPSPRAGHALLWLPKAKKLLLFGGYAYESGGGYHGDYYRSLPLEAWTYDMASDKWELIRRFEPGKDVPSGGSPLVADENDTLATMGMSYGSSRQIWLCRLDVSQADAVGAAKYGVQPGTIGRRTGVYDPTWYSEGAPAADPAKVKAELDALPANKWVLRTPPKTPKPNMDWGSAVFLPKADAIARFSGGHLAYSGTAPHFYDVKTDRWSMPFAPEVPPGHQCSDNGAPGEWSFKGNPWMPGHTWKTTGADPVGERLIYAGRAFTYSIGSKDSMWSRTSERHPNSDGRATTLCTTRDATIAWALPSALYRVDTVTGAWKQLPVTGTLPKCVGFDKGGLSWDSKRDRLLLFSPEEKGHAGDVLSYDMKTGEAKWLAPAGMGQAGVPARETIYLPESDMVMLGSHVKLADGRKVWPFYDCAKNAWFGAELSGDDPLLNGGNKGRELFDVSLGLVYDPNRKLVWMVGQWDELIVLKFDPKTAGLVELK
jgi:hypothetical protein